MSPNTVNPNPKNFRTAKLLLSISAIATVLGAGCGGTAYREASSTTNNGSGGGGGTVYTYPSSTPTYVVSPSPTDTGTAGNPPITADFTVTGQGGNNPTYTYSGVQTDNILRVKVIAGPAGQVSTSGGSYSNFNANYGCVTYKVTALGQTVTTNLLSIDGSGSDYNCPYAANTQTIDFSSRLTAGHGPVTVTVSAAGYDFYCLDCNNRPYAYGGNCSYYCPTRTVYQTHTVTGSLHIQINGTSID